MSQEHDEGEPGVGSVHEEAVRLLGALGEWAADQSQAHDGQTDHDPAQHPSLDGDCRFCPVCQVIHAVRQTSPEVRAHLTTAATALTQAAAELLATYRPAAEADGASGAAGTGGAGVERIDLDEESSASPE